MYKKKKRNVKSTFLMSNIYVFYVSVSASVAKRRKFEEGIGRRLVSAANLLLEISAGALVGCGFSLSRPREGRLLPSERAANGGVKLGPGIFRL